jgi:hypothetical protein
MAWRNTAGYSLPEAVEDYSSGPKKALGLSEKNWDGIQK